MTFIHINEVGKQNQTLYKNQKYITIKIKFHLITIVITRIVKRFSENV